MIKLLKLGADHPGDIRDRIPWLRSRIRFFVAFSMRKDLKVTEQEVEWIENSGEIPEVAFYAALSYLTEKEDGPKLALTASDIKHLEDAVINRYKIIIMRDLNYANRSSHTFRGMERAVVNYGRLKRYLAQKNRVVSGWKEEVNQALLNYINREYQDISKGRLYGTINRT